MWGIYIRGIIRQNREMYVFGGLLTAFGISGLFLGGCGWNPGCLAICSHFERFPTIVV